MRIGVVSDTHMFGSGRRRLPPELFSGLDGVELILHAGDLCILEVLIELNAVAPTVAVAGNNDPAELVAQLGWTRTVEVGGRTIGIVHGHGPRATADNARLAFRDQPVDAVVFGHSHQPLIETVGSLLLFNPGSATDPRREPTPSFGILTLTDGRLTAEIIPLPSLR